MQLKIDQLIDQCLSAISSLPADPDERQAWIDVLHALEKHWDITEAQLARARQLLRGELPSSARTVLTRLVVARTEGPGIAEFMSSYLKAVASRVETSSTEDEVLKAFYNRRQQSAHAFWQECVEVLGIHETLIRLTGVSVAELPDDAASMLIEERRASHRSSVVWDFVMVASPLAWQHPTARRPDVRARYWHALLDWPYDGSGRNSSHLVAENVLSQREAAVLEAFGSELRAHLNHYSATPTLPALVADRPLEAICRNALRQFFGADFDTYVNAIYSEPD